MTTVNYSQLGVVTTLGDTDLVATYPTGGPLKAITVANFRSQLNAGYLLKSGGTLTGALLGSVGTESLPGFAFAGDTGSGLYRIGAGNLGLAIAGVKLLDYSAGALAVTGTLSVSGAITGNASTATAWATGRAMTGDVTSAAFDGTAAIPTTLATVNGNVGAFTNASITVNGKGLITSASSGTLTMAFNAVTNKTALYTLVAGDAAGAFTLTSTGQIVIPANASVAFPVGTVIRIYNVSAAPGSGGEGTVSINSDTLSWFTGSAVTTGTRQLAVGGWCEIVKRTSTIWNLTGQGVT